MVKLICSESCLIVVTDLLGRVHIFSKMEVGCGTKKIEKQLNVHINYDTNITLDEVIN